MSCKRVYLKQLLILFLSVAVVDFSSAASGGDVQQKVRRYQEVLLQAKQNGKNTTDAERLNQQSRAAARRGDQVEALRLLDQAITALGGDASGNVPDNGERPGLKDRGRMPQPKKEIPAIGSSAKRKNTDSTVQPVFILPFTHHYNGPGGYYADADEVRRIGAFFARNHIPGTLFFDGILVERIQKQDPGLIKQIREWNLPIGYHGEETHGPYPVASDLLAEIHTLREAQGYQGTWSLTTGKDWDIAVKLVQERYSYSRPYVIDEKTHMLDRRQPSATDMTRVGGLKLVQQIIGKDVSMMTSHGLESAPEGYAFRQMSRFGFDQPAVPIALHALKIFRISEVADKVMAIAGENESIFWYMGRLNSKGDETGETGHKLMPLRRKLEELDRSKPRLLLMGFSKVEDDEGGRTVDFINKEFIPSNPGSAWVSGETLPDFFEPEKGHHPTRADIVQIADSLVSGSRSRPPDMISSGDRVFSICDVFEGLARMLATYSETANIPEEVELHSIYGPVLENDQACLSCPASMSLRNVADASAVVIRKIDSSRGEAFVPARIQVGDRILNCGEFLFAMARAVDRLNRKEGDIITVEPARVFPPYGDLLDQVFTPKAIQPLCYTKGQLWTVKSARLKNSKPMETNNSVSGAQQAPVTAASKSSGRLLIVFASNLNSDQTCFRDEHGGADLYTVEFDLETQEASKLKRLTTRPGQAEWFPVFSRDGNYVVYDSEDRPPEGRICHALRAINLVTGSDTLVVDDARCAAFSADGLTFFYSRQGRDGHSLRMAPFQAATARIGKETIFADNRVGRELVEDPAPFPDGKYIAFHRKEDKTGGAGVAVINIDGTGLQALTPSDGSGHVTISPDGNTVACTRSRDGSIIFIRRITGKWQSPETIQVPTDAAEYRKCDERFGKVREARHSYLEWIGPDLLLLTTHGADGPRGFKFARLFVVRIGSSGRPAPELMDISTSIEKLAGKSQRDFCSAAGFWIK